MDYVKARRFSLVPLVKAVFLMNLPCWDHVGPKHDFRAVQLRMEWNWLPRPPRSQLQYCMLRIEDHVSRKSPRSWNEMHNQDTASCVLWLVLENSERVGNFNCTTGNVDLLEEWELCPPRPHQELVSMTGARASKSSGRCSKDRYPKRGIYLREVRCLGSG